MTVIEQRILVEAPVEATWPFISEPTLISKWNRAAKQIAVLSTLPTGLRARRRCVDVNGRTVVEEVTAWLEHIGYEYVVVDGPYQNYRGRFRLQAIPEGTIVSWAVEYQLRGPMSGLRNVTSFRRGQEDLMADSLRSLRRAVEASGVRFDRSQHARYAMQSGPGAEARAARGVALGEDDLPEIPPGAVSSAASSEVSPIAASIANPVADGLSSTDAVLTDDTKPRPPKGLSEAIAAQQAVQQTQQNAENAVAEDHVDDEPTSAEQMRQSFGTTVPISMVAPPPEPDPETQTMDMIPPEPPKLAQPAQPAKPLFMTPAPDTLPEVTPTSPMPAIPTDVHDTSEISIWEVFGVQRPSERSQTELEAVIASLQSVTAPDDQPTQVSEALNGPSAEANSEQGQGESTASEPVTPQDKRANQRKPNAQRTDRKATLPVRAIARRGRLKSEVNVRRAKPN